MGVPFAVALGLLVAILDLIPLAGATVARIGIDRGVPALDPGRDRRRRVRASPAAENHFLQPVICGRTVQLSRSPCSSRCS